MNEKEINITIPEGYEIDKENSTFEKIVFKKLKEEPKRWRDDENQIIKGFIIRVKDSKIDECSCYNNPNNHNVFATQQQVKSAIAMARISQIMENDKRFGGVITDKEWEDGTFPKCVICRNGKNVNTDLWSMYYHFLAFHTKEQRNLFLEENEDLIKDYLMID